MKGRSTAGEEVSTRRVEPVIREVDEVKKDLWGTEDDGSKVIQVEQATDSRVMWLRSFGILC